MIEQEFLVRRVDFEIDVVVVRPGADGLPGIQRLILFGPSSLMNQAKEERSYEKCMAR